MRVMVLVKATQDSERGLAATAETRAMFAAMAGSTRSWSMPASCSRATA